MKRLLLILGTAVLLLNLVIPAVVHADGGPGTTNCGGGNQLCKP